MSDSDKNIEKRKIYDFTESKMLTADTILCKRNVLSFIFRDFKPLIFCVCSLHTKHSNWD